MKLFKLIGIMAMAVVCFSLSFSNVIKAEEKEPEEVKIYRLYNYSIGEHFYTADKREMKTLRKLGVCEVEGVAWIAPSEGNPVYRFVDPKSGAHAYSEFSYDRRMFEDAGWKCEGIAWYSGGDVPVYKIYYKYFIDGHYNGVNGIQYDNNNKQYNPKDKFGGENMGVAWNVIRVEK